MPHRPRLQESTQKTHQQNPPDDGTSDEGGEFPYDDLVFNVGRQPPGGAGAQGGSASDPGFPYDDVMFAMQGQTSSPEATEDVHGAQGDSPSDEDASEGATGGDQSLFDLRELFQGLPQEGRQAPEGASAAAPDVAGGPPDTSGSFDWPPEGATMEAIFGAIDVLKEALSAAEDLWFKFYRDRDPDVKTDLREAEKTLTGALMRLRLLMQSRGMTMPQGSNSLDTKVQDALQRIAEVWKEDSG